MTQEIDVIPPFALTMAFGTAADAGDVELVPAPGDGQRLVVYDYRRCRDVASDTTWLTSAGATVLDEAVLTAETPGFHDAFDNLTAWRLPANTALVGNNAAADSPAAAGAVCGGDNLGCVWLWAFCPMPPAGMPPVHFL